MPSTTGPDPGQPASTDAEREGGAPSAPLADGAAPDSPDTRGPEPAPVDDLSAGGGQAAGQPAFDAVADEAAPESQQPTWRRVSVGPPGTTVLVRHGLMRHVGQFRHSLKESPAPGAKVVIRTDRGVELGEVVVAVEAEPSPGGMTPGRLSDFIESSQPQYPLRTDGTVLRLANAQDLVDYRHFQSGTREEAAFCRSQIRELGLKMKLVTVEHLLGGERIIFYFTAEHRVDFRELVRRLAGQYRTRIEMRQVGARDEARLIADYERCGLRCCCQAFLKELQPVSMRMAKTQKATLDPSKISGRCGRLMCCLRYEDVCYEELRKRLPRRNVWVRTAEVVGRVVDAQILTQLVRLELADRSTTVVHNEDIVERDVAPPPALAPSAARPEAGSPPRPSRAERPAPRAAPSPPPEPGEPADEPEPPGPQAQEPSEEPKAGSDAAPDGGRRHRRRRPRRRRKHHSGPPGQAPR